MNSSDAMAASAAAIVTATARLAARSIVNRVVFGLFISEDSLVVCFQQMESSESSGNRGVRVLLAAQTRRDIEYATDRAVTQFETRIVVRKSAREWRAH